jgi:hypothetical protein
MHYKDKSHTIWMACISIKIIDVYMKPNCCNLPTLLITYVFFFSFAYVYPNIFYLKFYVVTPSLLSAHNGVESLITMLENKHVLISRVRDAKYVATYIMLISMLVQVTLVT